ncbi:MAG: hypothetical protein WC867_06535 [Candidatus Pacearchaeota archaeon]|jgi:hypothetical protein
MKKYLFLFLGLILINLVSASNLYYNITYIFDKNDIEIKSVNVIYSSSYIPLDEGELIVKIKAGEKTLSEYKFNVPNQLFYDEISEEENESLIDGGFIELQNGTFNIMVPYNEKGDNIKTYFENKEVANYEIKDFSKKELKSKEIIKNQLESELKNKDNRPVKIILFILIMILLYFAVFFIFRKKPIKNSKKGQASIFIIIALLIITLIGIFIILRSSEDEKNNQEISYIKNYIDSCIAKTGEEAIYHISQSGGYYELPIESTDNKIAFYLLDNKNNKPTNEKIEIELSKYVDNLFYFCLNNYEEFPDYEIIQSLSQTKAKIESDKVIFKLDYLVIIKKDKITYNLDYFEVPVNVRLGEIILSIDEIMERQMKDTNTLCMSCMEEIADKNNLFIEMNDYKDNILVVSIIDKDSKILGEDLYFYYANKYDSNENGSI